MLNTKIKQSGFTIVELLIVIVVIAILAAISIVAYNGIQNRGKDSAAASLANTVMKKAEAWNSIQGSYPTYGQFNSGNTNAVGTGSVGTATTLTTDANWVGSTAGPTEAKLDNNNVIQASDPTTTNMTSTTKYILCDTGKGAKVVYRTTAALVAMNLGTATGTATTCS